MQITLGDIAKRLGARLEGDPGCVVTGVAGLDDAGPGDVSFLANSKYLARVADTGAGAVIVPGGYSGTCEGALLRVDDPYAGFLEVLKIFHGDAVAREPGAHPSAVIHPDVALGERVSIGAGCVIEAGARIGDDTVLWPGVFVGKGARVGTGGVIHPRVCLLQGVVLGDRVIVQAGTVIGSDGFGYVPSSRGHQKIPQVGIVTVGDDVEIGANVTIDRGTLEATVIERGVKIDNLVHIAHNVRIGRDSLIVAQVGISGSTRVGAGVTIGGQAGVAGHVEIGEGARVGAQAGVTKSVAGGETVSGYPAMNHDRARKLNAHLRRLPQLAAQIKDLECRLKELEAERRKTVGERIL